MLKYKSPGPIFYKLRGYRIVLFCLSMILISGNVAGQKHLNNGNRYYSRNLFEEAIPYYLKEIEKGPYKSKNAAREKLADCYRLTGQFSEAEEMYKYLMNQNRRRKIPAYYLNYAKSLKSSAKYEEAAEQFKVYIELVPDDKMGPILLESCHQAQFWLDEEIEYIVKNFEQVNTPNPEFSSASYNGGIVFSSSNESSEKKLINLSDDVNVVRMDLFYQNLQRSQGTYDETENFKEINSHMHESTPTFNRAGTEVFFTTNVTGKKNKKSNSVLSTLQVFHSRKDSEGQWSEPVNAFSFARANFSVGQPSLSRDGKRIFFISDMPGGFGGTDIYYCDRKKDKSWGKPVNLGNSVNTFGHELFPYIDGRDSLYFSSDTHPGMGKLDIFRAIRDGKKWIEITNLKPPINSIGNDFGISMYQGQDKGFFSSDRFNGMGAEDIYSFIRIQPMRITVSQNEIIIPDLELYDGITHKIKTGDTVAALPLNAEQGTFRVPLEAGKEYELQSRKDGFSFNKITVKIRQRDETNQLAATVISNKRPVFVNGLLQDPKKGKQAERGSIMLLADDRELEMMQVNQKGLAVFNTLLEAGEAYHLETNRPGSDTESTLSELLPQEDSAGTPDPAINEELVAEAIASNTLMKKDADLPAETLNEEISFSGIASDASSSSSLSGIKIVLLHDGLTEQDTTTSADGEFHFSIEPGESYALLASKEGYQSKSFIIPANYSEGDDRIDLSMNVLEEVEDKIVEELEEKAVEELVAEVEKIADVEVEEDAAEDVNEDLEEVIAEEKIPEPEDRPVYSALSENQVDSAMNISFSVQIGAYKKRISPTTVSRYTKASENLPLRQYKDSRGYTLFQVGSFKEFRDADQVLQILLKKGIEEAFVIAYCNQERIQVTRARILTKDIFPQSGHEQQNYTTDLTSPKSLKDDIQ